MKLNQVITGCALAAGLMAVATSSQAGVVIGNTLYAPATIKAKLTYVDGNKFKSMSFGNKDILADSGYDAKGNQIAIQVNNGVGGVWVINSKDNDVVADLIWEGYVEVDNADVYINTESEKNNSYKYSGQGYLDVYFYTGYYSTEASSGYNTVNIYGNFTVNYSEKWNNNNPGYKATASLKTKTIQAESYDYDSEDGYSNDMPGTGSISAKGNGKLLYDL